MRLCKEEFEAIFDPRAHSCIFIQNATLSEKQGLESILVNYVHIAKHLINCLETALKSRLQILFIVGLEAKHVIEKNECCVIDHLLVAAQHRTRAELDQLLAILHILHYLFTFTSLKNVREEFQASQVIVLHHLRILVF